MNNEDVLQELQALKTKFEQSENACSLAERKLKESEVQYQHLIEAGTALIWISGTDKLCTYFNNNWLQFTGRTLEQEVGNGWAEGVHPDDFDRCLEVYITSFDKREPFEMEYRLRHASGEYRWLLDIGTPNYSSTNEFIGYIGHCFDISVRKKTELALIESEEKYRSIFESIQDVYYEASFDGTLLEVSPSIEIFSKGQYKREDVIGLSMASFYTNPSDRESSISKLLEESSLRDYELSMSNKDGSIVYAAVSSSLVFDNKGFPQKITGIIRDISERKMAENAIIETLNLLKEANQNLEKRVEERTEELRRSMIMQEAILQHAGLAIISTSADGIIEHFNKAAEEMLGYKAEEVIGKITPSIFHLPEELESRAKGISLENDDNAPLDFQFIRQAIHSSNNRTDEWTYVHKSGRQFPVNLTLSSIKSAAGKVQGYIGIALDITKEKEAKKALQKSEAVNRAIIQAVPDLMFRIHRDSTFLSLISTNEASLFVPKEAFIGKKINEVLPPVLALKSLQVIERAFTSGEVEHFEYMLPIQNQDRYFENRITPISEHEALSIIRDITERKKAEQEILSAKEDLAILVEERTADLMIAKNKAEESEQLYRLLIESIPKTSFFLFDKNLKFLIVGGEDIEKNGFNKSALIGKALPETLPQEVVDLLEPYYLSALQGKKNSFEWQFDNRAFFQQVLPIFNLNKEIFAGISISQDITDRKQSEKSIIENQRLSAVGEMTSSIAHDFNNTLQAMKGNIEIIKFKENLSDSALGYINTIETLVTDVSSRVKLLQRFGDSKQNVIDHKLVNLNPIISEVVLQLRPMWKDRLEKEGHIIHIYTSFCDSLPINCNEGEIKTVFHNILKNSIEAMPHGGSLSIKTKIKGQKALIIFTDTGIGMNEEAKSKIFQPFFSTKGFEAGRGLGMSGVYSVVKSFGGNIQVVSSEIGQGTTIEIDFTYNKQQEISVATTQKEQPAKKNEKLHVLWVEDDDIIRESISEMIKLIGHQCDTASSGKLALEYLDQKTYDIVLTDIGMTEMSGWQLADTIKEKFNGKLPVCVVSGWQITEEEKKEHGVAYSLDKPFTIAALNKLLFTLKNK